MQYVNSQLLASYGNVILDMFTAEATASGKIPPANMADNVHRNDTGQGVQAQAVKAKLLALGHPGV